MTRTVGELLTATLADIGATQVFGIVGDAMNAFTDAMRRERRMRWIGVRHEEGAALAAAGQAKLTGRLGVCAGTTGPGANHLLAGLYEARHDHAPVLAISGDVPTTLGGIDYLQAADHVQAFRDACVYAATIGSADAAPAQIHEAIAAAYGRRGVALLNIPQDVMGASTSRPPLSLKTLREPREIAPDPTDIEAAAQLIDDAKSVAIFVGHGARDARDEVLALAKRLNAPIVHTYRALDQFAFDEPLVVGGLGLIGSKAGQDAVHRCSLLLMIGSDYPYSEFLPQKVTRVVQIDERAEAIGRRLPVTQAIVGSSRPALAALLLRVQPKPDASFLGLAQREWADWRRMLDRKADIARSEDRIHPQALARAVSDLAAEDAAFCVDTGEVTLWTANWLRPRGRQRIIGSYNNAAVGTALGMANGVQALDPKRQVIVMCGDGGFGMLMQEFATAVQHRLPIKVFIFNNAGWGLVHLEMEEAALPAYKAGVEMRNPDFAMFARACGATGFTVTQPQALRDIVGQALSTPGPVIVDVAVDPAEIPAMPHVELDKVWRFGVAKLRETVQA
ncbi:thiamine pyrophosphate-binding protein [Paucibacter sp. R3-3]|uniref:Thiamine pyrophosphate-binding protein n=1 Tax=Roseateles agri TaxID=3098619 RepID=A0ABU5DN18_9BURK|nr:thiamine pyrophosphate-dependent enzyme [Paucibacter sp. R3-3]MDY0747709.1 thiamine pyrophosphate-binding protein [Paucibacter sp. R3-3]